MKHDLFPIEDYEYGRDSEIAVGNFGVTYRAKCRRTGIDVALKYVSRLGESGPAKVDAEERGAILQDQFGRFHRKLVPEIYEHGRGRNGDYFIAMEFLEARSLAELLKEGPFEPWRAARIAYWIAEFLDKLHSFRPVDEDGPSEPIVHSDLKPEHVLILHDGSLRVLDFGITKILRLTKTSTVNPWASIPYASPRRLKEGVVDRDSDFWALGVMYYEMTAGHHLYPDLDPPAMARAIERQDRPAGLPPCNPAVAAIIHKMLAPQREQSYQSAREIASDLEAFLAGRAPMAASERLNASVPTTVVPAGHPGPSSSVGTAVPGPAGAGVAGASVATTRRDSVPTLPVPAPSNLAAAQVPARPLGGSRARAAIALVILAIGLSEGAVWIRAEGFRQKIYAIEAPAVSGLRKDLNDLSKWSLVGLAVPLRVTGPLKDRLTSLGERPILDYRTDLPIVTEKEWEQARACLAFAAELAPEDHAIAAKTKYVRGQLTRISAQNQPDPIQLARLDEAVETFKESARLDPSAPDPYLGLARIHAYDLKDVDALVENLREAETRGHKEGRRELAQLGDAYRFRADKTRQSARRAKGSERVDLLEQAAEDYQHCMEKFTGLSNFLNSEKNLALCVQLHERVVYERDGQQKQLDAQENQ